jgi:hypothetical protein
VDGTWNVPTTLTFVGSAEVAFQAGLVPTRRVEQNLSGV